MWRAKVLEHLDVAADPDGKALTPGGLDEGEVAGSKHAHEDLGVAHLPGVAVHHRHRVAGVVHEDLLPRRMLLAQDGIDRGLPRAVEVAVAAVLEAVEMVPLVLEPEQLKRDPGPRSTSLILRMDDLFAGIPPLVRGEQKRAT